MGQLSPPFGAVTARLPPPTAKTALLTSTTVGSVTLVTRIRACAVAGPDTVQLNVPVFAAALLTIAHDVPPLRDTSIFTFPVSPLDVHWMARVAPIGHTSPPFGAVTATLPPPIVKFALLTSDAIGAPVRLLTRIRACALAGPFTSHVYVPEFAALPITTAHEAPPLRETSIFTLPVRPEELHWMARWLPMGQVSPPLGVPTVMRRPGWIVKLRATSGAGRHTASPACAAVTVQSPGLLRVTVLPATVQAPAAVKLTDNPDDAVAATENGGCPNTRSGSAANAMVCSWRRLNVAVQASARSIVSCPSAQSPSPLH